jgi:hypothetical protein
MRHDDGSLSPSPGGRPPVRTASHPGLETRISRFAVLAKDLGRIPKSPGEPQTALRQPGPPPAGDPAGTGVAQKSPEKAKVNPAPASIQAMAGHRAGSAISLKYPLRRDMMVIPGAVPDRAPAWSAGQVTPGASPGLPPFFAPISAATGLDQYHGPASPHSPQSMAAASFIAAACACIATILYWAARFWYAWYCCWLPA